VHVIVRVSNVIELYSKLNYTLSYVHVIVPVSNVNELYTEICTGDHTGK